MSRHAPGAAAASKSIELTSHHAHHTPQSTARSISPFSQRLRPSRASIRQIQPPPRSAHQLRSRCHLSSSVRSSVQKQRMVGVTKRRVQAGRRDDFEGASSKATRLEESTGDLQRKLHRHFNETAFMQGQWRVRVRVCVHPCCACIRCMPCGVCGRTCGVCEDSDV